MGTKHPDLFAAMGCSDCHAAVDGRTKTSYYPIELREHHLDGVFRTQQIWLDEGLIEIK